MRVLEGGPDDRRPARSQLLRPAERDQVGLELLRRPEDLLVAAADAGFQPDVFHSDRTVPGNELTGPLSDLVLGLVV